MAKQDFRISERLRGMGIGSLFLALFGALWMVGALNAQTWPWLVGCVLVPVSLLVMRAIGLILSSRELRATEPPPTPEERQAARAMGRGFGLVFMVEFGLIAVAANWLAHAGRQNWTTPVIGILVGIHFVPLARVFDYAVYYWTGAAEIALCLAIPFWLGSHPNAVDPLVALGMGLSLWVTVLIVMVQARWLRARAERT